MNRILEKYSFENPKQTLLDFCKDNNIKYSEDRAGNIIIHFANTKSLKAKKIMVPILLDNDEVVITDVNERKAKFISNIKKSALIDCRAIYNNTFIGTIKSENEIELFEGFTTEKGNILSLEYKVVCKDNLLYTNFINNAIQLITMFCCILSQKEYVNDLYFTVSFCKNSLKYLLRKIFPDFVLPIYAAKEDEGFNISDGCGIVFKDGNYVASPFMKCFMNECAKDTNAIPYIGKKSTLNEELSLTVSKAQISAICVPVKYMDTPNSVADLNSIKAAVDIVSRMLSANYTEEL